MAALLVFAVQFVFASFTLSGNTNNKKSTNKYSLKNLSKFTSKGLSLNTVRFSSKLNASEFKNTNAASIQITNGNTTFIYPYKVKIKVPKFKTPTAAN